MELLPSFGLEDTARHFPNIVALYSPGPGSGKSEVAKTLVHDYGYTLIKFADPLKNMVRALLISTGISNDEVERYIEGDLKEYPVPGLGVSPRYLMQTLGTEWGRSVIRPNLWIDIFMTKAKAIIADGGRVTVDDMRFENEYDAVFDDAMLIEIVRPGREADLSHDSEGRLDAHYFDYTIINDGTVQQLQDEAATLIHTIPN